jgi:flagellin
MRIADEVGERSATRSLYPEIGFGTGAGSALATKICITQERQMSLTLLNNISALYAENNLTSTQANLQTTLQQLSSGSRINSGADDPAGLAISDGLGANEAALTQSSQNASDGIGLLQTADGALSQVTSLLDQAVTLATESANGTLTSGQVSSANQEYQNILSQIGNIGSTTNFNSSNVFSASATNIVVTDGTSSGLNTYADIIGALNTSSVGTTAAAAVTTTNISPSSTSVPLAPVVNTAGQYTFTPNNASDLVSGTLTFAVGNGSQASVSVGNGSAISLTALQSQLATTASFTGAGLTASLGGANGNSELIITGPTNGANAAADTVSFSGSNLVDNVGTVNVNNGVTAVGPSQTTSTLAFAGTGVAAADNLSGSITYQVGSGAVQTFTLAAGTTINTGAGTDIAAQLNADSTFQSYGLTASANGTTLTVKGPLGNSENITLGTGSGAAAVKDTTHSGITVSSDSSLGSAGVAGTKTLTFATANGNTVSGSIVIGGQTFNSATSAQGLKAAINANTVLQAAGISASGASNIITITGNATTGTTPTITGSLTDTGLSGVNPSASTVSSIATSTLSPFSSGSAAVIGGTIVIDGKNIAVTGSPVNGTALAQQINAAMLTTGDGITASFNSANATLTINGNANGSALPTIDASGLTDSGQPVYNDATVTTGPAAQVAIQSTQTLAAFSGTGGVVGGSITINGNVIDITAASNGTSVASQISDNAAMVQDNVTASFDTTTKQLTIMGATDGSSTPDIESSNLTDSGNVGYTNTITPGNTAQTVVVGSKSIAAFSGNGNTIGGSITIDGHEIDLTANSDGTSVANQISTNSAMETDNIGATFDTTTHKLTIWGATDGSSTPTITANNITDSGAPYQGVVTPGATTSAATATFNIGSSDTLTGSIEIAGHTVSGASASVLASAINTAAANDGVLATYSNGTLTVTANPSAGVGLNIQNNTLSDSTQEAVSAVSVINPTAGSKTTSSIALGNNAANGDVLAGNISYSYNGGASNTFNIANGTTMDNNGSTGISTALNADATFSALGLTANVVGTTLTITGPAGSTDTISLNAGTLTDTTHNLVGTATNNTINGSAGTAATKTLSLNSATDTFGGSLNITSGSNTAVQVSINGMNGAQAAAAITDNASLFSQGVSANWNATSKTLTVTGNSTGTALTVAPVTTVADNAIITDAVGHQATGGPATGATSTITLGTANDTLSGNLSVVVGISGTAANNLSMQIQPGTSGSSLVTQINGNASFKAAGVSAAWDQTNHAVVLTGPTGLTNTLNTSASTLTDYSSAAPQGGANFTTASVSTLTAQTASQILTTVTAAVADVAYQRGTIGADVNELSSASSVASAESVNLTSAQNTVDATDYGQAASNMSKYQILSQTGISALAQANSVQQEVLKLLQ